MDLQLKPEWEGSTLRDKCFPMSKLDADEMSRQVEELVKAGLVEEYSGCERRVVPLGAFTGDSEQWVSKSLGSVGSGSSSCWG